MIDQQWKTALGSRFLQSRTNDPILVIGSDTWSRTDLAKMGIVETLAARILTRIVRDLNVRSTKDLYEKTSPYSLASTHAGVTTLYVLFSAFRAKGLNIRQWYQTVKQNGNERPETGAVVSFTHFKHREQDAEKRTNGKRKLKRAN